MRNPRVVHPVTIAIGQKFTISSTMRWITKTITQEFCQEIKKILIMHKGKDAPILSKRAFWNEVKCYYLLGYFLFSVATKRRWVSRLFSICSTLSQKGSMCNKWHQLARLRHRAFLTLIVNKLVNRTKNPLEKDQEAPLPVKLNGNKRENCASHHLLSWVHSSWAHWSTALLRPSKAALSKLVFSWEFLRVDCCHVHFL